MPLRRTPPLTPRGRGLGAVELERPLDRSYGSARKLIDVAGATGIVRASMADLVFIPPGFGFADQETNQECVGWVMTQLLHVGMRAMGLPPITPSPGGTYFGARARRYGWDSVWDGGCNPHEAFEHVREVGFIPYAAWPHSVHHVNDNPDPDAYRRAADHDWVRPHWVLDAYRTPVVKALLASHRPVGAALRVDAPLEDWQPGNEPWERTGPILGGHDVTIVGFDTYGPHQDKTVFIVANSWGKLHGDAGFFLMSETALESEETSYVCTIDIDPERTPT